MNAGESLGVFCWGGFREKGDKKGDIPNIDAQSNLVACQELRELQAVAPAITSGVCEFPDPAAVSLPPRVALERDRRGAATRVLFFLSQNR
jgi:hypothetical protein